MILLIWADEKYNTQKNPGVFHRPKKIPFGQNVRPKKILRTPPSLKYVSGAPGFWTILSLGVPGSKEPGKFKFWGSCQYQAGETTYNREFTKRWRSFNVEILKNYNCTPTW